MPHKHNFTVGDIVENSDGILGHITAAYEDRVIVQFPDIVRVYQDTALDTLTLHPERRVNPPQPQVPVDFEGFEVPDVNKVRPAVQPTGI